MHSTDRTDEDFNVVMAAAYDAGINFFDTAEVYNGGHSEVQFGQAIKKYGWKRESLVISTKIYWGSGVSFGTPQAGGNLRGLSRKHIIEGTKASLKRLGLVSCSYSTSCTIGRQH